MLDPLFPSSLSAYQLSLTRLLSSVSTPKLGLERTQALLIELGNPERSFKSIHVAGTNGKGSTCAFLCALSRQKFERVGLYTSPHLLCARERIQINDELVSESVFCESETAVFEAANRINEQPTFFEKMTAMAFWTFRKLKVEMAVIEVGLGGRLDATNVIDPLASIITRIDLDHVDILGNTLAKIAYEKAGIIKFKTPVITGWQNTEALESIRQVALSANAPLKEVAKPCPYEVSLVGPHQKQNAALAIEATRAAGFGLRVGEIESALLSARVPCRFEIVHDQPSVILDGAHNGAGILSLVKTLCENPLWAKRELILVLGATQGHDIESMIYGLLPLKNRIREIIVAKSNSPRALPPDTIIAQLVNFHRVTVSKNIQDALGMAEKRALTCDAIVVVTGSLYICGEARGTYFEMPSDGILPIF